MIRTTGAVWDGADLVVTDELEVREPGPGEVSLRVLASGICHSDLNVLDGHHPVSLPVVLGHEAAGVVDRVGDGVTSVGPGDPVVVGSTVPCGTCRVCVAGRSSECPAAFRAGPPPFRWRGQPVRAFANTSSWAGTITVRASQVVPAAGIPATSAALIGCAVSTGYGVVRNVAQVRPGDAVVVFGVGGIGVNVIQTARLAGAARVLAVDVNPDKAEVAARFGAHDTLIAATSDTGDVLADRIRTQVGLPVDVAVECSGAPAALDAAIACTAWGGTTALVGIPRAGTRTSFAVDDLLCNRRIVGSLNGSVDLQRDFSAIIAHVHKGDLEVDAQVSRVWPLRDIAEALAAVRAGSVVRAVLTHAAVA
jgi:S-(hydroxymethyl)glutathione dehydrogenase / alcohol dehydrogenase